MRDWDDAFANSAYIPQSEALPRLWAKQAQDYRAGLGPKFRADLRYGHGARQVFDLVLPDQVPRGLMVFVHGGYWLAFGKSDWSHLAEGARMRGWAVALPQYTLAPKAGLPDMVLEVARAIVRAAGEIPGPIRLAGHSAGGHLVVRMICDDSQLPDAILGRLDRVVSISGLHELRPLLKTRMNDTLQLTDSIASAESAILHRPHPLARDLTCWVGAGERPEFRRQSRLLSEIWSGLDLPVRLEEEQGKNHFSVIDGLSNPNSALVGAILSPAAS
ncbi:alpha/beta hydrolase [Tabrizicola oligotrophica]|uniref:Alpha/beta hydrolase n=1 Tax=Tabrizicola oligotrophica TaxID=2710650 RepID=A0A6M0QX52_9RHOB|nr:alpha/beta hydrolase [Tabrizicola oligotrophica]NEY92030.1 alpha/beta hydrolase [Tabrizicola oligotrophica]